MAEEAAACGCAALARFGPAPAAGLRVVHLPRDPPPARTAPAPVSWEGGSVLVDGEGGWEEWSQDDLIAAAERFGARLATAAQAAAHAPSFKRPRREILVLPRPLADPAGRRLAAWSLASGAALALEPDRERLAATAAWVRPTLFSGAPGAVAALREAAPPRRRKGLPFRRLHTVAVLGGEPLPEAEAGWWRQRGVVLTVV